MSKDDKIKLDNISTSGGGLVDDVRVNGTSVVVNKVAHIPLASPLQNGAMSMVDKGKLDCFKEASEYALKDEVVKYTLNLNGNQLSLMGDGAIVTTVTLPSSGGGSLKTTDDGNGNVTIRIV